MSDVFILKFDENWLPCRPEVVNMLTNEEPVRDYYEDLAERILRKMGMQEPEGEIVGDMARAIRESEREMKKDFQETSQETSKEVSAPNYPTWLDIFFKEQCGDVSTFTNLDWEG